MTTYATWDNNGPNRYDCAINGVPFFQFSSPEYPYFRQTISSRKEQIDTTVEPGEQSLQGWWYRSQSSFDFGAGSKFFDTARSDIPSRQFADSAGVEVFNEGEVSLLRKSETVSGATGIGAHYAIPLAAGGEEGVLVSNGTTLQKVLANGTVSTVNWGGTGTINGLTTDGGAYFVANGDGVYRGVLPSQTGTKIYSFVSTYANIKVFYVKEFLFVIADEYAWAVAPSPSAVPTVLEETPDEDITATGSVGYIYKYGSDGWIWTGVAGGPVAVYGSGYIGDTSYIYSTTIDTSAKKVEFAEPYVVAELPPGELVLSMISYLGTYLIIGTNRGVRVAIIQSNGTLAVGPLTLESDNNVHHLMARDNFAYAGGAQIVDNAGNTRIGLYKIDLSQITNQSGGGTFAWSKSLYEHNTVFSFDQEVQSIVPIGYTGRIAFTIKDIGLVFEDATERVDNGWIETGKIRFDTAEDKIFQYIRVNTLSVDGALEIKYRDEVGTISSLYSYNTDNIRTVDTEASDNEPHPWASYRFVLTRGDNIANSPILLSYQLKAQPANVKQRAIRVVLQCYQREEGTAGRVVERPVWERVQDIEAAERKGSVVRYQDFNTGEDVFVIIEEVQFIANTIATSRYAKANPGGRLVLTLRTV